MVRGALVMSRFLQGDKKRVGTEIAWVDRKTISGGRSQREAGKQQTKETQGVEISSFWRRAVLLQLAGSLLAAGLVGAYLRDSNNGMGRALRHIVVQPVAWLVNLSWRRSGFKS